MDDIEKMIGEGRKRFTLLYSISRDACDPDIFHQRCDNKGPTVTMLYNLKGSVFGFYSCIDWKSEGNWKADRKHFLIQLNYLGNKRYTKCLTKGATTEILWEKAKGPWSEAIKCFSGKTLVPNNNVFTLNGNMDRFTSNLYDTCGLSASDINNGSMEVTDLEVYSVADGERPTNQDIECPWRTQPQWNTEYVSQLFDELSAIEISTKPRLLLLGPIGAGKSSFVNTVASALAGRMAHFASCGTDRHAATSTYSPYRLRSTTGSFLDFKLCDTPGLERSQGIDIHELHFLLDGNVPENYDKLGDIFMSTDVGKLVNKTAKMLGVPRNVVFPIKNYEHEMETLDSVNSLALFALKTMVEMATDHLANLQAVKGAEGGEDIYPEIGNMSDT
ncbi:IFI44-like protein, partial [Mya arenaria]